MNDEQKLESIIRQAGEFVSPSDRLRASTLDAARQNGSDQNARKRFTQVAIALGLLLIVLSPVISRLSKLQIPERPSASELKNRVIRGSTDPAWSLVELFTEMREVQSDPDRRLRP